MEVSVSLLQILMICWGWISMTIEFAKGGFRNETITNCREYAAA